MTLSFERRVDLQNGVYKMDQNGVAQPQLPSKPGGYPFYFAHDPTHFVEKTAGGIKKCHICIVYECWFRAFRGTWSSFRASEKFLESNMKTCSRK